MDALLVVSISLLIGHELDAVHHHEWRLLFFLRRMDDRRAQQLFTAVHVPILIVVLALLPTPPLWLGLGLDCFMVVHLALHRRLHRHEHHTMTSLFSQLLVVLPAALGAAHAVWLLA